MNIKSITNQFIKEMNLENPNDITPIQLNKLCGEIALKYAQDKWEDTKKRSEQTKLVAYISMEFLMGRAVTNNLLNLGIYQEVVDVLKSKGIDINKFEDIADQNLGNGGLGRLAACYIESAATCDLPVYGYSLRYKNGFFKQQIVNGEQQETSDTWLDGDYDPWSVRHEDEKILVKVAGSEVFAVPYDIPIFGCKTDTIGTLRVWQAEPAGEISNVLYPNDDYEDGKILRLSQEYLLTYATLQDLVRKFKKKPNHDFSKFNEHFAVQLNDTHPVMGIPILYLILEEEGIDKQTSLDVITKTFAYTNHTILAEALEKWDGYLIRKVAPQVFDVINMLNIELMNNMREKGYSYEHINPYQFIVDDRVYMARLAIYYSHKVNGVAKVHTEILKKHELGEWNRLFPNKIINKTNGITFRRWLAYANTDLADLITQKLESNEWIKNAAELEKLKEFVYDDNLINEFIKVKKHAKCKLAQEILKRENVEIDPESLIMIQVKRIHEYKRQLLNLLGAYDYYTRLKTGELDINTVPKVVDIMGGKAAPGYKRAKAIIRLAKKLQEQINNDPQTNEKYKFIFITNFNASYGEIIYPAADVSKQISTAGKEASGTGNMKFMANGAVTLGTFDGANIEIFLEASLSNNYAFGAVVDQLKHARRDGYNPHQMYTNPSNFRLKRAVDCIIEGRHDNRDEVLQEIYRSLIDGWYGEIADRYYLLKDFYSYVDTQDKLIYEAKNELEFARKQFYNIAASGKFSSDRAIKEYAVEIWDIKPIR